MRNSHFFLIVILIVAAILRINGIGAKSLWFDEAVTASYLDFSPLEIIARCAEPRAVHPPLYYLAIRCWAYLVGDSEIDLRGPSVAFGLATIVGFYLMISELVRFPSGRREATSDGPALLAATLVAISPLQIELSRTARGYTMATACLSFGGWALLRALRGGRRTGDWVAAGLLASIACHVHNIALLSVIANGVFAAAFVVWNGIRTRNGPLPPDGWSGRPYAGLRGPAIALGLYAMVYLIPWVPKLFTQSETVRHGRYWPITWERASRQIVLAMYSSYDVSWELDSATPWAAVMLLAGIFTYLASRGGWHRWYLVVTGLLPPVLMVAFSLGSDRSIFHARYLCFAQLAWLGGAAVAVADMPTRVISGFLAAELILVSAYSCYDNWSLMGTSARPGMRAAIRFILDHRAAKEPIVAQTPYVFFGAKYYSRGTTRPLLCVRVPRRQGQYSSEQLRDEELITPDRLVGLDTPGVWLVTSDSYAASRVVEPEIPAWWERTGSWSFDQDRWLERPIFIVHYRNRREAVPQDLPMEKRGSP